jgi:hypothetical protein
VSPAAPVVDPAALDELGPADRRVDLDSGQETGSSRRLMSSGGRGPVDRFSAADTSAVEPGRDVIGIKADQAADFHERNTAFGDKPADVPGSGTQAFCELPDAQQTGKFFGVGHGCYLLAQGLLRNCGMEISDREYSINARNCLLLPTCAILCHRQPSAATR